MQWRKETTNRWGPPLLLLVLTLATLIFLDRPLIRGDGVAYLAWLDSFALDQDIDFDNQLQKLAPVNTYQLAWNDETERLVNIFPFGAAILQTPFYWLGHFFLGQNWWNVNPDYFRQMQGVAAPYSFWVMIGANVMALTAVILTYLLGKSFTDNWTAALVAWGVFLGTPLVYYATVSPLNSHNPGALMTAVFFFLLARITGLIKNDHSDIRFLVVGQANPMSDKKSGVLPVDGAPWGHWLLLGVSAGLMVLVRWQLLMVVLPGYALLLWDKKWRGLLVTAVLSLLVALPLPLIWNQMFGQPIVIPYQAVSGDAFLKVSAGTWWVLRQTPRYSPILWLSFTGLFFLWRVDKRWAVMVTAVILIQVIINGAVLDWWGGETYGVRRMSELYPLYGLLACLTLQRRQKDEGNRMKAAWQLGGRALLFALVFYSGFLLLVFLDYTWTNQDGLFIAGPPTMIRHFLNQPNRWQILGEVLRVHVGPASWSMPGP